jgi:hypothetical protein
MGHGSLVGQEEVPVNFQFRISNAAGLRSAGPDRKILIDSTTYISVPIFIVEEGAFEVLTGVQESDEYQHNGKKCPHRRQKSESKESFKGIPEGRFTDLDASLK